MFQTRVEYHRKFGTFIEASWGRLGPVALFAEVLKQVESRNIRWGLGGLPDLRETVRTTAAVSNELSLTTVLHPSFRQQCCSVTVSGVLVLLGATKVYDHQSENCEHCGQCFIVLQPTGSVSNPHFRKSSVILRLRPLSTISRETAHFMARSSFRDM